MMAFVFVAIVCHLRLLLCKMRPLSIVLLRSSYFPTFQSMLGLSIRMPVEKMNTHGEGGWFFHLVLVCNDDIDIL